MTDTLKRGLPLVPEIADFTEDELDAIFGPATPQRHDAHVLLWRGFDLMAAGVFVHDFTPCPFCELADEPDPALILTERELRGEIIKYVCCGSCGTCGPWGYTETSALAQWNRRRSIRRDWGNDAPGA